ncbi:MAG: ATP-binding cassette domain-containing protein [Planctomycetes bacterium]|nr:ATP-binding cassette domain-containing protein [Planctomycetota bacterium]
MAPVISINGFSYRYPDGTDGLYDISLDIAGGEKIALIGPNGSGKSTLLLAMGAFLHGHGSIVVDGVEANKKNAKQIRRAVGSVLQNPDEQLFMPTLLEDVAFGPLNMGLGDEEVLRRSMDALGIVGLDGMKHKAPHHLSAGQKRSAAIATILSMNPKIITMDEPDTSLDPRNRNNLTSLLKSLKQTLIIATCNIPFAAALCKRAVLIDSGKIIADGPVEEIITDEKLMQSHGLETAAIPESIDF